MSMYVPKIKEEISENAKMLVEDGGIIVRTEISGGAGLGFDIVVNYYLFNDTAELVIGDYAIINEKMINKKPIFAMICEWDDNRLCYDYPKYIEYAYDYIGLYNEGVDEEFQIYPDNHIEINHIG